MAGTKRNKVGLMAACGGLGAVGIAFAAPAFACSGISTLEVTPVLAAPGAELQVVADGFSVRENEVAKPVELWWVGEGGKDRQMLGTATPDAEGKVMAKVTAPASATVGSYLVKVREPGATEDRQANALVKMVESPLRTDGPLAGPAGNELRPLTTAAGGFDPAGSPAGTSLLVLAPLGLLGVALVGVGGVVAAKQVRR